MTLAAPFRLVSNKLWTAACRSDTRRFERALDSVEQTQRRILENLLRRNASTAFGREHGFDSIDSPGAYGLRVPLTDYEDYRDRIAGLADGKQNVLTAEDVLLLEPSSGTASASKLIPYTRSLRREFQFGISPWISKLFRQFPNLLRGSSYWSLSPPGTAPQKHGNLRVGFASDRDYLGRFGQLATRGAAAVPDCVSAARDMSSFQRATITHLLLARDLGLVSVWSPTFLGTLLDYFETHRDEVLQAVGTISPRRAREISHHARSGSPHYPAIWPSLEVLSCWTHGASAPYAESLAVRLPQVFIQPKGLLATEAFVSLPWEAGHDPVLAVNSHFFEFIDQEDGSVKLAHELSPNALYSVVVSTGGGLYRYKLSDLIQVTGFLHGAPCLRFIGKEQHISDLCGEKLHAAHVEQACLRAFAHEKLKPTFFMIAPVKTSQESPAYGLFLKQEDLDPARARRVASVLEKQLEENFHYAHCRALGQLGNLRVFKIGPGSIPPESVYLAELNRRGMKLGNIKPSPLDVHEGWEDRFSGHWIA